MDEKGVYGVARSVWDCEAFMRQKFTQREAWLWLVGAAVWKQTKVNIEGRWVTLERSEFCYSSRFLAKKWRWKKDAVLRFMKHLKNEAMIRARERASDRDSIPVYSVCKYNEFQVVGLPSAPANAPADAPPNAPAVRQPCAKEEALQTLETLEQPEEGAPKGAVVLTLPSKPVLPDWLPMNAWRGYCEMRRKARKPVTDHARDLILSKLDRWRMSGHDPGAILDNSTANGWTGIFEPKGGKNGRRNGATSHDTFISAGLSIINGGEPHEQGPMEGAGDDRPHGPVRALLPP
jgi:hypothetical protein